MEGEPQGGDDPNEVVRLLQDLEEYPDPVDRPFQAPRSTKNPLPQFQIWCVGCARTMSAYADPIENFREFGFPPNSPDGPYAQFLRNTGWGRMRWRQK